MAKDLYIVMGLPGSGKSTWLETKLNNPIIVSRDAIRFELVKEDEDYFSKEKEVFNEYVKTIQEKLDSSDYINVFADATHISQKSRNKLLNRLNLQNVDIHIIYINTPLEECLKRNALREGREKVPDEAIVAQYEALELPNYDEKYKYKSIIEVHNQ